MEKGVDSGWAILFFCELLALPFLLGILWVFFCSGIEESSVESAVQAVQSRKSFRGNAIFLTQFLHHFVGGAGGFGFGRRPARCPCGVCFARAVWT